MKLMVILSVESFVYEQNAKYIKTYSTTQVGFFNARFQIKAGIVLLLETINRAFS